VLCKVLRIYNDVWHWDVREDACRVFVNSVPPPGAAPDQFLGLVVAGLAQDIAPRTLALCADRGRAPPDDVMRVSALAACMQGGRNVAIVSRQHEVSVLLNVLRRCGDSAAVCAPACAALLALAPHEKNCAFINKSRGIPALLRVVASHPGAAALDLLAFLVRDFPNHQANFRTHNGRALLEAALRAGLEAGCKRTAQDILLLCAQPRRSARRA